MERFCRTVGYFYVYEGGERRRCAGCAKIICREERLRLILQFTGGVRPEGETRLWLLYRERSGSFGRCLADCICMSASTREYCLTYCMKDLPLPEGGAPIGVMIVTESGLTMAAGVEELTGCEGLLCERQDARCMCEAPSEEEAAMPWSEGEGVLVCSDEKERSELMDEATGEAADKRMGVMTELLRRQEEAELADTVALEELLFLPAGERLQQLMRQRPTMNPFVRSPFDVCARISLCDVHLLFRELQRASGNSFLCHSYYRYRHLLLAMKRGDNEKEPTRFYVLAPGIGNGRDRRMGELYGFREFYGIRGGTVDHRAFGYYAMELPENDL